MKRDRKECEDQADHEKNEKKSTCDHQNRGKLPVTRPADIVEYATERLKAMGIHEDPLPEDIEMESPPVFGPVWWKSEYIGDSREDEPEKKYTVTYDQFVSDESVKILLSGFNPDLFLEYMERWIVEDLGTEGEESREKIRKMLGSTSIFEGSIFEKPEEGLHPMSQINKNMAKLLDEYAMKSDGTYDTSVKDDNGETIAANWEEFVSTRFKGEFTPDWDRTTEKPRRPVPPKTPYFD